MRPKVLHLLNSFHQGGSERQAVQLVRLLCDDATCDVFLACLTDAGSLRNEVELLGFTQIPEYKLSSFFSLNFIKQARNCAKFIRQNKIEIVHTHDFYTNVFGMFAATLAGVKLKIAAKRETGGIRSKAQEFVEKFAFGQATIIVANSGSVKSYLVTKGVSAEKIKVIYNGLDLERLTPKVTDRKTICENLGLPSDEKIRFVTLVANFRHTVKNQTMLLRAAQKVLQEFPEAHFVFAGEGELKMNLENLARQLQTDRNTHFIGLCRQVPELLSISFAGVLTSFNEGFSNSILEYMAAGKPVVATRVGGAGEAIIENETGFLIESNDDESLANRLIELLKDEEKAEKFGTKGRQIVEETFSLKTQLRNTLKLYKLLN